MISKLAEMTMKTQFVNEKRFYVYAIYIDGVVRYIGKGSGDRLRYHVTLGD